MNQNSPLFLDIEREIDSTLAETHRKIADLGQTANRMNSIISESKFTRVRKEPRTQSWVRWAAIALISTLIITNAGMAFVIFKMNADYEKHVVLTTRQQEHMLSQIRCMIIQRENGRSRVDCLTVTDIQ